MIIKNLIDIKIIKKMKLQMIIKTINETVDENNLIFILLMFDAYPCIHKLNFFYHNLTSQDY